MRHGILAPALLLLAVAALVPGAAAHATYATEDDAYSIVVGYKGEPVYTYQPTGLDILIRTNDTERAEVPDLADTLTATLVGPGGEELTQPLQVQHGAVGRYSFTDGFVLTQPGLYKVRLVGDIQGTPVDGEYAMAHVTKSQSDIMFPDNGLSTIDQLEAQVQALEARLASLEAGSDAQASTSSDDTTTTNESPPVGVAALLIGALAVALIARRR